MTVVHVEFFGIARQRAGTAAVTCPGAAEGRRLGQILADLELRFPRLAPECIANGRMGPGYLANVDGERFVSDPETLVRAGHAVLIMSADAGG